MISPGRPHYRNDKSGFTIVELLIVIVVIGILAAITIVAYNGIQKRTYEATVQSDLANLAKKLELVKLDTSDNLYPLILTQSMGFSFSKSSYKTDRNNIYYAVSPDRSQYAVGAVTKAGDASGFYLFNGVIQVSTSVYDTGTKALVNAATSQVGYGWNSTTSIGSWQAWVN